MLRVYVDSGCSIKQEEKEKYGVEIIPLKILLGEKEYLDGVDLPLDVFYKELIENNQFPLTSLPSIEGVEDEINNYTSLGDDVIILTISSEISGTYNFFNLTFKDNPKVFVVDSRLAVGGMRIIVNEINKNRHLPTTESVEKINELIPRICIAAVPETLEYLIRGGRLNKLEGAIGKVFNIKPIIGFRNGKVKSVAKKIGFLNSAKYVANLLDELECDTDYEIIPSYTYNKQNIDKLISMTNPKYLPQMKVFDNLDPAIACHWGPNAYGYIFVAKNPIK